MDQLKGKVVNVVLTIQEGKGMESIKNSTLISANFNGRILESDPVNAEDCPAFNTNLIWEIEKKDLRKIRSSNQPLRVECLSVDNQSRREKFGHVLLDLRSAQIVEEPEKQVSFKWQKLIGVRNKKRNCVPELYLSLTIRNHLEVQPPQESSDDVWEPEPRPEGSIPIKYLEDGYIMVGDSEKCTEDYSLNINIKSASSLDLLLPEVLVFHQNNNKYCMCIKIFGIPIKTKQFSKDLHDKIIFEEKIVVRLLSNITILEQFFNEEKFEVGFNCGNDLLGLTTVSFNDLTNLNEKLLLPTCFFRFPSPNGIVPVGDNTRKPSVSLEIYLIRNREELPALVSNLEQDVSKACGDYTEQAKEEINQQLLLITEEHMKELEEWKERQKAEFEAQLQSELEKGREEMERKKVELNENIIKCKELQEELQEKLDELKLSKTLKKKRKSSTSLVSVIAENQKKFAECDKELLIDYISTLQSDNENLKQIINEQKQELENIEKTALTKEQTTNLLQELKGLEEKFQVAQQTKTYFKEQWQKACQEIHNLKTEDYKQLQNQLRERREELDHLCILDEPTELVSF
ncbi:centrosomal protein of 120 kDa-like [Tribolium madens]|uniref:centrosomal protein of 120 kDa-like n=1 Tax=Tribolium madens TaxID=41895 RepID=UPI001CF7494F|nr:centrosomal protein of 120 kDa-like [Tribolium madens]